MFFFPQKIELEDFLWSVCTDIFLFTETLSFPRFGLVWVSLFRNTLGTLISPFIFTMGLSWTETKLKSKSSNSEMGSKHYPNIVHCFGLLDSSDRSSYSENGLWYIYPRQQLFQIFTQSLDAVTSVNLSRLNSINAIDVTRYLGDIFGTSLTYL